LGPENLDGGCERARHGHSVEGALDIRKGASSTLVNPSGGARPWGWAAPRGRLCGSRCECRHREDRGSRQDPRPTWMRRTLMWPASHRCRFI